VNTITKKIIKMTQISIETTSNEINKPYLKFK